ncbi:hypothetical protein GW17_00037953 [Ensete ventricosum]|nr:hypothetical protein GW17_00037953 [Ensete ventricosum]
MVAEGKDQQKVQWMRKTAVWAAILGVVWVLEIDMFNLMRVKKSVGHAAGQPVPPPPPEALIEVLGVCSAHGEKRPDEGGSEPPKKKMKVVVSKHLKKVKGTFERDHHDKGKEPAEVVLPGDEAEEPLKARWRNFITSTRVWTDGSVATEYVRGSLHPDLAKQLYEFSSEELIDRAAKSVDWVERLKAELETSEQRHRDLELVADSARIELREVRESRHQLKDKVLSLTKGAELLESHGSHLRSGSAASVTMVADIYRKMAAKRSELEGNSDGGGRRGQQQHRLQLRCDFMAAGGIDCSKGLQEEDDGVAMYTTVAEEGNSGMERETATVVFNLLLAVIKIVGSERLLRATI